MASSDLSDLKPVYLIYGDEELLLERAVRRLRDRLSEVADLDFNMETFDGESASADDVVAAANTLPFMSDRRLVIVRNVDKMPTATLSTLADYAADPAEHTALVLVARKLARNTRLFKAVDALKGAFEYRAPKRSEYPRFVADMFRERGVTIGVDAAELFVRAVGRDLRRLQSEVDKAVAFTGGGRTMTREDVEAVISTVAPVSVFDMTDAIGLRDTGAALRLLASLVGQGETVLGLHAMSVRHVRSLLSARALLDRGENAGAISREVGMPDWQARKVAQQAGRFTVGELVDSLRGAADAELQMKTSQADARLVLERWIVGVCEA